MNASSMPQAHRAAVHRLSEDRLTLSVRTITPRGVSTATYVRPASDPWTDDDVTAAIGMVSERVTATQALPGEKRRASRHRLPLGLTAYVHVNTGPPTWWVPRVHLSGNRDRFEVMVGWLRGLVAVHVTREARPVTATTEPRPLPPRASA